MLNEQKTPAYTKMIIVYLWTAFKMKGDTKNGMSWKNLILCKIKNFNIKRFGSFFASLPLVCCRTRLFSIILVNKWTYRNIKIWCENIFFVNSEFLLTNNQQVSSLKYHIEKCLNVEVYKLQNFFGSSMSLMFRRGNPMIKVFNQIIAERKPNVKMKKRVKHLNFTIFPKNLTLFKNLSSLLVCQ